MNVELFKAAVIVVGAFVVGFMFGSEWMARKGCPDCEEEWCGCDGEGMAHLPGTKGFLCGEEIIK